MPRPTRTRRALSGAGALTALCTTSVAFGIAASADDTQQDLPYSQSWSNTGAISTNDDWSGVPGVIGYRGDGLTDATGTDPRTITAPGTTVVDVNANQTNPNGFTTGGVTEFELADPTVALTGSGTADAPFLLVNLRTTGQQTVSVSARLRDLESGPDNAVQPVALQYRVGTTGDFLNPPAAGGTTPFVPDATTGPNTAGPDTVISATLPDDADNQQIVQVRFITTNALGNDEWVGVDDISVLATPPPVIPEVPAAVLLPLSALALAGGAVSVARRRGLGSASTPAV